MDENNNLNTASIKINLESKAEEPCEAERCDGIDITSIYHDHNYAHESLSGKYDFELVTRCDLEQLGSGSSDTGDLDPAVVDGNLRKSCYGCRKPFNSSRAIEEHLACHCGSKWANGHVLYQQKCRNFMCCLCYATFESFSDWYYHVKWTHRSFGFKCTGCDLAVDSSVALKNHMQCQICSRQFQSGSGFHNHIEVCKRIICNGCKKTFSSVESLQLHMKCSNCGRQFQLGFAFHKHVRSGCCSRLLKCTGCKESFPSLDMLLLHKTCALCGQKFQIGARYHDHASSCKFKKCTGCEETFRSTKYLMHHLKCCFCDLQFENGLLFHEHVGNCGGSKKCTGSGCKRYFLSSSALQHHLKCSVCHQQFPNGVRFHKHKKSCKSLTKKCTGCTDVFPTKKLLKLHMKCLECNVQFQRGPNFHKHVNICKKKCTGCKCKFSSSKELELHMKCTRCGRQFRGGSSLHKHLARGICKKFDVLNRVKKGAMRYMTIPMYRCDAVATYQDFSWAQPERQCIAMSSESFPGLCLPSRKDCSSSTLFGDVVARGKRDPTEHCDAKWDSTFDHGSSAANYETKHLSEKCKTPATMGREMVAQRSKKMDGTHDFQVHVKLEPTDMNDLEVIENADVGELDWLKEEESMLTW